MSLETGKPALKNGILALHQEMMTKEVDSLDYYADQMTELIYTFVKSAELEVNTGISVSTTGTAAAQTGTTTTKGTGILK